MTKRTSRMSAILTGALCLGVSLANSTKAAPARVSQSAAESLATAQQMAPDAKVTQVYWGYHHRHRYWAQSHRIHGRYYR